MICEGESTAQGLVMVDAVLQTDRKTTGTVPTGSLCYLGEEKAHGVETRKHAD